MDLLLTARDTGFSHVLIVKTRAAAASSALKKLTYGLSSTDLTFTADEVFSLDGLAGPGIGGTTAIADAALTDEGEGDGAGHEATLTVTPDADFLSSEDTELPLFIDPSFAGHKEAWTTAYTRFPGSSFWNGTNFNDGTSEARVGYESTTYGKSRSFFRLDWSPSLKGAQITSASVTGLETYSWSCNGRTVQLWETGAISSKTTWNNQPSWKTQIDSKDLAHGYSSSCPDDYVKFDAKSLAQDAADGGWDKITIGLKAAADGEDDAGAWKKFKATGDHSPYIKAYYNRKLATPTSLTMTPGPDCDRTSPYAHVGKSDLVFAATSSDKDGNLASLDFEVWRTGYGDSKILDKNLSTDTAGHASATVASSKFTNGYTYSWRVRALDSEGAASAYAPTADPLVCRFVYDSDAPNSPKVSSTDFPEADDSGSVWSEVKFGTAGSFSFAPDTDKDVTKFEYSFNSTSYSSSRTVTAGASTTVSLKPPVAGPSILYVRAADSSGNVSEGTKYLFYVTPRDVADTAGDTTGDGNPDLLLIDETGNLRLYPASSGGDLHVSLDAAHRAGVPLVDNDESGYWKSATGSSPALIAHGGDLLPGDGATDLIARMPDGKLAEPRAAPSGQGPEPSVVIHHRGPLPQSHSRHPADQDRMVTGRVTCVGGAVQFGQRAVDRGQAVGAGAQAAGGELVTALGREAHGERAVVRGEHAHGEPVAVPERRRRVGGVRQTDQNHRRLQRDRAERTGGEAARGPVLATGGDDHDTRGEAGHRRPKLLGSHSRSFPCFFEYFLTLRHDGAPPVGPHGDHRGFSSLGPASDAAHRQ